MAWITTAYNWKPHTSPRENNTEGNSTLNLRVQLRQSHVWPHKSGNSPSLGHNLLLYPLLYPPREAHVLPPPIRGSQDQPYGQ